MTPTSIFHIFIILLILTLSFLFQSVKGFQYNYSFPVSIQKFGVLPGNKPEVNRDNLQKAIDWASPRGAALYVEPVENPYEIASGLILKKNVFLIGVHGPTTGGTKHRDKPFTVTNPNAVIQAFGCFDKAEDPFNIFPAIK